MRRDIASEHIPPRRARPAKSRPWPSFEGELARGRVRENAPAPEGPRVQAMVLRTRRGRPGDARRGRGRPGVRQELAMTARGQRLGAHHGRVRSASTRASARLRLPRWPCDRWRSRWNAGIAPRGVGRVRPRLAMSPVRLVAVRDPCRRPGLPPARPARTADGAATAGTGARRPGAARPRPQQLEGSSSVRVEWPIVWHGHGRGGAPRRGRSVTASAGPRAAQAQRVVAAEQQVARNRERDGRHARALQRVPEQGAR